MYRSRIWTCQETGKSNFTYREALESERKAAKKIEVNYPQVWVKPTLEMIQFSRLPLNELVDQIYDFFRGTRYVDEVVFIDVPTAADRIVERVVIREKLPNSTPITLERRADKRQIQRELRESREDMSRVPHDDHHYRVQLVNNPTVEYIVLPNQMRRGRQVLSKQTFKKFVKESASREKVVGSHWIVKSILVARFGLNADPPAGFEISHKIDNFSRRRTQQELYENPIEDTELFEPEYAKQSSITRPIPNFDMANLPDRLKLPLLQSYTFLYTYGPALNLYPFIFNDFVDNLEAQNSKTKSTMMPEIFGSLLALACKEYQSKFDSGTGLNRYAQAFPSQNEDETWSQNPEESQLIGKLANAYQNFSSSERAAVDQWYKWRPNQWLHIAKGSNHTANRLKAWPVALFGLIRDWFQADPTLIKWQILHKLLFTEIIDEPDLEELTEGNIGSGSTIDDSLASSDSKNNHGKRRNSSVDTSDMHEDPLTSTKRTTRARSAKTIEKEIKKPKLVKKETKNYVAKSTKKTKSTEMQFEELCTKMEYGVCKLSAEERILIINFLTDCCVLETDPIRIYRDTCNEKVTELKKEQRELIRSRKALATQIHELAKKLPTAYAKFTPQPHPIDKNESSMDSGTVSEMDSEERSNQKSKQSSIPILGGENLTAEQIELWQVIIR